jgi:hypothetical protein
MADHFYGPGQDPRVDLTDLFVFRAPGDVGRSVLIMGVDPVQETLANGLHPDAIYEWLIDTDGDYVANLAFGGRPTHRSAVPVPLQRPAARLG